MTKPLHLYGPFPQSIKGATQVFDYSRMVGRFFEPDDKICLIFDNLYYHKLRELPEYAKRWPNNEHYYSSIRNELKYPDMPRAREWADEFEEGIQAYDISADQIKRHKDVDWQTMYDAIEEAYEKIKQNARQGRRTLLLFFYAGHGYMCRNSTFALLNSNQAGQGDGGNEVELEDKLRLHAREKGAYVISLIACNRSLDEDYEEDEDEEEERGGTEATSVPRPIEEQGQCIFIFSVSETGPGMTPETPSLAKEFLT